MDITEIIKVGQWLNFKAGTCFGEAKNHLGILVAISDELSICIAINATSNVNGVKDYATFRHINPTETIVIIEPEAPESSYHFGKQTAFDCNRPVAVRQEDLIEWVAQQKIKLADFNTDVDERLLARIKKGILDSPLVPEKYKKLIRVD